MNIATMTEDQTVAAARAEMESILKYTGPIPTMAGHRDYNHVLARLNMVSTLMLAAQLKRFSNGNPCVDE